MKVFVFLIIVALGIYGYYYFFGTSPLDRVTIEGDSVSVDTGDYLARFSAVEDFEKIFMLFGGGYFSNKKLINPISISGLEIENARGIYERYPDFHLCKSAGAPLAQNLIEHLSIIPSNKRVLSKLRDSIEEHEDNLKNDRERVCVTLTGKVLNMQSAISSKTNRDIKDAFPQKTFYLITSSRQANCEEILGSYVDVGVFQHDEPVVEQEQPAREDENFSQEKPGTVSPKIDIANIEELVTNLFIALSGSDIDTVYSMASEAIRQRISRHELQEYIDIFFTDRKFKRQYRTWYEHSKGTAETVQPGVYREAWVFIYYGVIEFTDGNETELQVVLADEDGQWKVQYFELILF